MRHLNQAGDGMTAAAEAKHLQPPAPHRFQILLLHFAFLFGIFCCVATGLTPVPWHMALVHAAAGCTGPFGGLPNDVQQRVQSAAAASRLLGNCPIQIGKRKMLVQL
ncbi:hypothetical protein ABPG77_010969 [Micractinium sp. CCAP 211/92]